jgi:O-antigen ligase
VSVEFRRIPRLAPSRLTYLTPAGRWSLGAAATAAVSVTVGYAVSASATYAAAGVIAAIIVIFILTWPRRSSVSTYEVLIYTALVAYLVPMLALGKFYATIGVSPIYLPDVLIVVAALLMLPLARLQLTRPFPLVCSLIALLVFHSVYIGYQHGYHEAVRGIVLALYPLIALVVAGWLANQPDPERLLSSLPKYVLPVVAVGLAVLLAANASVIASATGLYLAFVGAFAVVPTMPRRRWLGFSCLAGTIMLAGLDAKRGPLLALLLAVLVASAASRQFRSDARTATTVLAIGAALGTIAMTINLGILMPTQIPVAGRVISRAIATNSDATTRAELAAANNVGIREAMWSYALHSANTSPLFGLGANHPIEVDYLGNNVGKQQTGPHNSFVGYAFYAGYPAAALVVLAFVIAFARMWRLRSASIYAPALLGAIVAVVVTALTNVAFETTYIGGPSWLVLGAAVGLAGAFHNHQAMHSQHSNDNIGLLATQRD